MVDRSARRIRCGDSFPSSLAQRRQRTGSAYSGQTRCCLQQMSGEPRLLLLSVRLQRAIERGHMLLRIDATDLIHDGFCYECFERGAPRSEPRFAGGENLGGHVLADDLELPSCFAVEGGEFRVIIPGSVTLDLLGHQGAKVEITGDG